VLTGEKVKSPERGGGGEEERAGAVGTEKSNMNLRLSL